MTNTELLDRLAADSRVRIAAFYAPSETYDGDPLDTEHEGW
jgi:hypothetical protein